MMPIQLAFVTLGSVLALGCGAGGDPAPGMTPDAPVGMPADARLPGVLPAWALEDIQPVSPRVGQTYGLDGFTGKIIVVSLLEGF